LFRLSDWQESDWNHLGLWFQRLKLDEQAAPDGLFACLFYFLSLLNSDLIYIFNSVNVLELLCVVKVTENSHHLAAQLKKTQNKQCYEVFAPFIERNIKVIRKTKICVKTVNAHAKVT
jgi:hypothetical protein